jgi:hypothetical protein
LVDETEFPDFPSPPTRPDRDPITPEQPAGQQKAEGMELASAMIAVSCVCIVAIAAAVVIVAMKRLQRRRKEAEAVGASELEEVDRRHIPKASCSLPQLPNIGTDGLIQAGRAQSDV